ncbi:MAG: DsbA family protein [Gammaproteobacteria bacterium]|nr:DsbA family protein [Gammaproteobacteria bacterium]
MYSDAIQLHVFSDYICPFCYIANKRLQQLDQNFNLSIHWYHIEIHPDIPEHGIELSDLTYQSSPMRSVMHSVNQLSHEDNISLKLPNHIPKSQKALLLAEAAKQCGDKRYNQLHNLLFSSFYSDDIDIGDNDHLLAIAAECDIPSTIAYQAWRDPHYQSRLQQNHYLARQMGIHATPAFIVGEQVLLGVQSIELLHDCFMNSKQVRRYAN